MKKAITITFIALAVLWTAGTVNQYLNNVTYNKCKIADNKYNHDEPLNCQEVLNQP